MIFEELLEYTKKSKTIKNKINSKTLSPFIWYCVIYYSMLDENLIKLKKNCSLNDEWKSMSLNEKKEYEKLSMYYGYQGSI